MNNSPSPPGDSVNSQDGDDDSESDSSDDGGGSSKYDSADFQSSLKSFQMSESKRKRLRELEASPHSWKLDFKRERNTVLAFV